MDFVCSHFQFGTLGLKSYQGLVLADRDRLLFIPRVNANLLSAGMLSGVAGAIVAGAVGALAGQARTGPHETLIDDLAPDDRDAVIAAGTTAHTSWKKFLEKPGVRLLILPRAAVQSVALSIWSGGTLQTDLGRIKLLVPLVQMRRARLALSSNGWLPAA